jgi:hypothetical protein
MTVYFVTVLAAGHRRYFDSIWVNGKHANERAEQLRQEFKRCGFEMTPSERTTNVTGTAWGVVVTTAECLDGQLAGGAK